MPSVASEAISATRIWSTRSLNAVESVPTHARDPNASDARSSGGLSRPSPSARTHAESRSISLISWDATQISPTCTTVNSARRLATDSGGSSGAATTDASGADAPAGDPDTSSGLLDAIAPTPADTDAPVASSLTTHPTAVAGDAPSGSDDAVSGVADLGGTIVDSAPTQATRPQRSIRSPTRSRTPAGCCPARPARPIPPAP
jgi:hypothetical protein